MARMTVSFFSKSLLRKTEIMVIVPTLTLQEAMKVNGDDYYQSSTDKYPLFIMMAGFADEKEAWLTQGNIQNVCDKYKIAAVLLESENKWYLDCSPIDNWHTFVEKEIPDFVYGNFSRVDSSKRPVICGDSMGGFGALWNGLTSPDKYSAIISLSPALKPDGYLDSEQFASLKDLFLKNKGNMPIVYLSVGDQDFIINASMEMDNWLKENEIGVRYEVVPGHGHNYDFWRVEFEKILADIKNRNII